MSDFAQFLESARERLGQGRRLAMATIVAIRGSTYRQVGAKLLIDDRGDFVGSVSGGCLEGDLAERAQELFAGGSPFKAPYDLSEDAMWSLGIGCNGVIEVFVELLPEALLELYEQVPSRHVLQRWVQVEGDAPGSFQAALDGMPVGGATELGADVKMGLVASSGGVVFCEIVRPAPQVLVFGAGHDAIAMVGTLAEIGFHVEVLDPRPAFLTPQRFPTAQRLHLWRAGEEALPVAVESGAFAVVMQHHKMRDTVVLKALADTPVSYIGLLGPRKRGEDLMRDAGVDSSDPRIYSPVGLDIGAEAPEQVALSVTAEITAVAHSRHGGSLRRVGHSIHA